MPGICRIFLKKDSYDPECCKLSQKVFRSAKKKFRIFENDTGLKFSLGESANDGAVRRFSEFNRRAGIDMDVSRSMMPEVGEDYGIVKDLQQHCDAGAFFSNGNKNLTKDKDFLFLKLV